eukprot:gene11302-23647_t
MGKICRHIDYYLLLASVFVPVTLFLGVFLEDKTYDYNNEPPIIASMKSSKYLYVLVVEMAISGQMLLDILVEAFTTTQLLLSSKGSMLNALTLMSLFGSSVTMFFYVINAKDYILLLGIHMARIVYMSCTVLSLAREYGKSIWTSKILVLAMLISCLSSLLKLVESSDGINPTGIFYYQDFYLQYSVTLKVTSDDSSSFDTPPIQTGSTDFLITYELTYTIFVIIQAMYQTRRNRKEVLRQKAKKSRLTLIVEQRINNTNKNNNNNSSNNGYYNSNNIHSNNIIMEFVDVPLLHPAPAPASDEHVESDNIDQLTTSKSSHKRLFNINLPRSGVADSVSAFGTGTINHHTHNHNHSRRSHNRSRHSDGGSRHSDCGSSDGGGSSKSDNCDGDKGYGNGSGNGSRDSSSRDRISIDRERISDR